MAVYTQIDNPELYFQCKLFTGTGSSNAVTLDGDENMQPDLVWIKDRGDTHNHNLFDSVRGVTKRIHTDTTDTETTNAESLKSFDSDGFTVGTQTNVNQSSHNNVAWCWKAGGSASSNSDGDITSSVSANTTAGFSILTYTGNGTNGDTVGTGLNQAAEFVIVKPRDQAENWNVQTQGKRLNLNLTLGSYTSYLMTFNTSTVALTDLTYQNGNNYSMLMYAFHSVQGFSKFGSYLGNGNASGCYIHLGFRPSWILLKQSSASGENWLVFDNKRLGYNVDNNSFNASANSAEATGDYLDLLSNGFKIRSTNSVINGSGSTYIYMAIAEASFVNSKGVPCNAR